MVLKCLINDFVLSYWLIWSLYSLGKPCEYIKTISTLWINKYKITPLHIQINKINVAASVNTQSFCKFLNQNTCKFLSLIMAHIFLTTSLLAICKKKPQNIKLVGFTLWNISWIDSCTGNITLTKVVINKHLTC